MIKPPGYFIALPILLAIVVSTSAQQKTHKTKVMTGSAAKGSRSAGMEVVPDLSARLYRFREVRMPFRSAGLSPRELKMVGKLVDASRCLEEIYWRQIDPDGLTLYQSLAASHSPEDQRLRRYLRINASRYDLLDENKPFVGTTPTPPGRGFYPQGLTRDQIEKYVKDHPEKRDEIYSSTTVVRWHGDQLEGLPYHIAYRSFLEPAAKYLREAAVLSGDQSFADFLRLRADALLTDDYLKSDIAWLKLKDNKFDVIFAPYEIYEDGLLGVKASYGGAIMVRNAEESRKLAIFQKYVPDIQDALPLAAEYRPSKRGLDTPMEVMDTPFRAGDLNHGYQAVADNLPNDPRIQKDYGSKKMFFKNFMDARVAYVIMPLAKRVMAPEQAAEVSDEGYMLGTILHEISHGLGPASMPTDTGRAESREAIGPIHSSLEEAKADVVGMFGLKWLVDHNALPKDKLKESYASYIAEIFRSVRFGVGEAHGQAMMIEFNYLLEHNTLQRQSSGKYVIDYDRIPDVLADLAKELLEIEAKGDRERAETLFNKYGAMPTELQLSLKAAANVPVDIDPIFSFKETVK